MVSTIIRRKFSKLWSKHNSTLSLRQRDFVYVHPNLANGITGVHISHYQCLFPIGDCVSSWNVLQQPSVGGPRRRTLRHASDAGPWAAYHGVHIRPAHGRQEESQYVPYLCTFEYSCVWCAWSLSLVLVRDMNISCWWYCHVCLWIPLYTVSMTKHAMLIRLPKLCGHLKKDLRFSGILGVKNTTF